MQKTLPTIIISTFIGFFLFVYLYYSETGSIPNFKDDFILFCWFLITINVVGFALKYASRNLNKFLSWRTGFGKRFFLGLLIHSIITYLISFFFIVLYFVLPFTEITLIDYYAVSDNTPKILLLIFIIIFFYSLIDFALYSYYQFATEQIESIRLKREKINLQYEALRNQLSPHFLFNSLNTISSLIYKNAIIAENFIRQLALSYNNILVTIDENLSTIADELNIIESYKYLMEVRFERAFSIDIKIPEKNMNGKIPSLSLQMLVENAIKHNKLSEGNPLKVRIYCDENKYIIISNNFTEKAFTGDSTIQNGDMNKKSTKIGLENIKRRYLFYTSKKVLVEKTGQFIVKLPIL